MANIYDVASFFIDIANGSDDDQMTNLKLNKLMYYAQGVHIARTGTPLFDEQIEAWQFGPVVPCIYRRYKVCGDLPIPESGESFDYSSFSDDELETLLDVMRELGQYTGSRLVSMTHRNATPWSDAIDLCETTISRESMARHFTNNPIPHFKSTAQTVRCLPKEWYNPEEDAEWEAYL